MARLLAECYIHFAKSNASTADLKTNMAIKLGKRQKEVLEEAIQDILKKYEKEVSKNNFLSK